MEAENLRFPCNYHQNQHIAKLGPVAQIWIIWGTILKVFRSLGGSWGGAWRFLWRFLWRLWDMVGSGVGIQGISGRPRSLGELAGEGNSRQPGPHCNKSSLADSIPQDNIATSQKTSFVTPLATCRGESSIVYLMTCSLLVKASQPGG